MRAHCAAPQKGDADATVTSQDDGAAASPSASKAAARKNAERPGGDGGASGGGGSPSPAQDAEQTGRVTRREAARRTEAKAAAAFEMETIRQGNLVRLGCATHETSVCRAWC